MHKPVDANRIFLLLDHLQKMGDEYFALRGMLSVQDMSELAYSLNLIIYKNSHHLLRAPKNQTTKKNISSGSYFIILMDAYRRTLWGYTSPEVVWDNSDTV